MRSRLYTLPVCVLLLCVSGLTLCQASQSRKEYDDDYDDSTDASPPDSTTPLMDSSTKGTGYALTISPEGSPEGDPEDDYDDQTVDMSYYKLYDYLTNSSVYNKFVRPVKYKGQALDIFLTFHLLSLVEMDEKSQTMKMIADLTMEWDDQWLGWRPEDFGDIRNTLVPQDHVWTPDIIVSNSVEPAQELGYKTLPVRIYNDGFLTWSPSVMTSTSCSIIVTYYPFDTQKCEVVFQTAVSFTNEVYIYINKEEALDVESYSKDGSWKLISYSADNLTPEDEDGEFKRSKVKFVFLLERRTRFYVVSIILPILLLTLTSSLVFALPADAGEKMGTSITVVLAFAVYLTIITEYLPDTSTETSVLAVYLTCLLGLTVLSVFITVLILRLHHTSDDVPVGGAWRCVTLCVQRLLCMRRGSFSPGPATDKASPPEGVAVEGFTKETEAVGEEVKCGQDGGDLTWQDVAKTIDWLCFIIFTVASFVTTAICLVILVIGGAANKPQLEGANVASFKPAYDYY